jgi:NAD(P)-dependent dehydrogenase (short-subunit alcohol dehydrogenase family)
MFNENDCMGTKNGFDTWQKCRKDVKPLTMYRGAPLTTDVARKLLERGRDRGDWIVTKGLSAAYDCLDCQMNYWLKNSLISGMQYVANFKVHMSNGSTRYNQANYQAFEFPGEVARYSLNASSDGGLRHEEDWRLIGADESDDPQWATMYYCGAAAGVGMSYEGAMLMTPDGVMPKDPATVAKIDAIFKANGLDLKCYPNNSNCGDHPSPPTSPPPPPPTPLPPTPGNIGKPCFATATAQEIYKEVDMSGKVALITGADKGIGLEIAKALALRGATVIPGCRKAEEMNATASAIKKEVPNAKVYIPSALLDLSSFQIVRDFAQSLQHIPKLDLIVNDAGMANNPHGWVTPDGMEEAFQIDYPSQWLLTYLLMPQVRKAKGRVVNLVSKAYRMACPMSKRWQCMNLDRLPPPVISGSPKVPLLGIPVSNYGIARLLMIRWTEDLARREQEAGSGVTVYSVNPGFVNTSMADSHNLSPVFEKLACMTDDRPGAPCPTTPPMGGLTPTFLSLAPGIAADSGKYFEWCMPAPVNLCLDVFDGPWIPTECTGADQDYKDGLWKLTAKWVENFTAPLAVVTDELAQLEARSCPSWLGPICHAWECATGCLTELKSCITDKECRASLMHATLCSAKYQMEGKSANDALACFVPVNALRDKVFFCLLDEHSCIHPAKDKTIYPTCRDATFNGDASYKPAHLLGDWWKVTAWTKGEMYECRPCGKVTFEPFRVLPWPVSTPENISDYAIIASSWFEKDDQGKTWVVNETSYFGPRPSHKGFPEKQNHRGVMYGLSYLENFTVVHDGTQEAEPFLFLYGCGSTIQGAYVTGFVMAKIPRMTPTLKARIFDVAKQNGFDSEDEWCTVDNTCAPVTQTQFVI